MSINDSCENPAHEQDMVLCPDCWDREAHPRCYTTTEYFCGGCIVTVLDAEREESTHTRTVRIQHEFMCRDCAERGSKHGRTAKPRRMGGVQFHSLEIISPLYSRDLRGPIPRSSQGMAGRAGRDRARGAAAARAKAAAHRLMHRVQNSYGIRQCVFCNLLTHNRFRPLSHPR